MFAIAAPVGALCCWKWSYCNRKRSRMEKNGNKWNCLEGEGGIEWKYWGKKWNRMELFLKNGIWERENGIIWGQEGKWDGIVWGGERRKLIIWGAEMGKWNGSILKMQNCEGFSPSQRVWCPRIPPSWPIEHPWDGTQFCFLLFKGNCRKSSVSCFHFFHKTDAGYFVCVSLLCLVVFKERTAEGMGQRGSLGWIAGKTGAGWRWVGAVIYGTKGDSHFAFSLLFRGIEGPGSW